jgi:molybdenum cofactor cytidylyltransferase
MLNQRRPASRWQVKQWRDEVCCSVMSVASSDGLHVGPPALFGRGCFGELVALSGDAGARALLTQASLVEASSSELLDVDTAEDLARLRGLL